MEFTLDQLTAAADKLGGDVKDKVLAFVAAQKAAGVATVSLTTLVTGLGHSVAAIAPHLASAAAALNLVTMNAEQAAKKLFSGFGTGAESSDKLRSSIVAVGLTLEPLFMNILPRGTAMFGELGSAGVNAGAQISDTFTTLQPILAGILGEKYAGMVSSFAQIADGSRNLEANLIGLASASGDLDAFMSSLTGDIDNLSSATTTFAAYTYEAAQATGSTVSQAATYASQLGKIPGALRENISLQGVQNTSMNMLTASMTLATSFGMNYGNMANTLNDLFRKFNVTGQHSLEIIAQMATTAQELKLPMDLVSQSVMDMSSKFLMFGDNTQSAINIMQTFGKAFQESGLSPEGITKLIGTMTTGLAQMDIGTKAFVSGASGGRGGLAGAFELDLAMKRGDMGSVMAKAMQAMQREVGGRIVTLEETVQTPALAGQMMKQIAFLRDVMHMAQTPEEAYRVLDAMKKGAPGELGKPVDTQAALRVATERGVSIQERHTDILRQSANYLSHISQLQQIQLDEWRRKLFGTSGAVRGAIEERMTAGREAAVTGLGIGAAGSGRGEMTTLEEARAEATRVGPEFDAIATGIKGSVGEWWDRTLASGAGMGLGGATTPATAMGPATVPAHPATALAPAHTAPTTGAGVRAGERPGTGAPTAPRETVVKLELTGDLGKYIRFLGNKGKDANVLTLMGHPGDEHPG
jgi:hypothetical protein